MGRSRRPVRRETIPRGEIPLPRTRRPLRHRARGRAQAQRISYAHAEGYPAGELKHGPNALVDEKLPVVVLATCDHHDPDSVLRYRRTLEVMKEVKSRHGRLVTVATEGDREITSIADDVFFVPAAPELLLPIVEVIPLQLFAYHVATKKGYNVDRPEIW